MRSQNSFELRISYCVFWGINSILMEGNDLMIEDWRGTPSSSPTLLSPSGRVTAYPTYFQKDASHIPTMFVVLCPGRKIATDCDATWGEALLSQVGGCAFCCSW